MQTYLHICQKAARAGGQVLRDWIGKFLVHEKGPADLVTEADVAAQNVIQSIVLEAFPDHSFVGEESPKTTKSSEFSPPSGDRYRWIVDPLDGTTNYVHQFPMYCVSVGLEKNGTLIAGAVYDPTRDECFYAAQGMGAFCNGKPIRVAGTSRLNDALVTGSFPAKVQRGSVEIDLFVEILYRCQAMRRNGSAAMSLAYLAAGRLDTYWAISNNAWDVAAGVVLVREAGGVISGIDGRPFAIETPHLIAATTEPLLREIVETFQQVAEHRGEPLF